MPRHGFCATAVAGTLGLLLLAACGAVQTNSSTIVGTDQTARQPPPNIAALQAAENGRLQQPAFVEFYSNDCDICRRIQGPMRTLDLKYDDKIKFIYVDIDLPESQPFVREFNVRGIPTFALLSRRGDKRVTMPGWPGEDQITQALDKLTAQP